MIRVHYVVSKTSKSAVNAGSGVAGEEVRKHQTGMPQRLYLVTENSRFYEILLGLPSPTSSPRYSSNLKHFRRISVRTTSSGPCGWEDTTDIPCVPIDPARLNARA